MSTLELSWPRVLAGGFLIVTACIAATYQLVALARQSEVAALKEQVATAELKVATANLRAELQDRRVAELERLVQSSRAPAPTLAQSRPQPSAPQERGSIQLQIHSPSNQSAVGAFADVKVTLNEAATPRGHQVVLVVRDPIGQWWSWGTSASNTWSAIQIGVAADSGRSFEIRALLTDVRLPVGGPLRDLPHALAQASITVVKK